MSKTPTPYILTQTAEHDFRDAKAWSMRRWGTKLTRQYFKDLEAGATYIANNHHTFRTRDDLAADTGLMVYPVREHYIVFLPLAEHRIVIVALLRQGRDVPTILSRHSYRIAAEVKVIHDSLQDKD